VIAALAVLVAIAPVLTGLRELVPGVRVGDGVVEFDARVAIDCHNPATPDVYLEMLITAPDSREHESLLVTRIEPSNLHAALLAAGLEPGDPVRARGGARLAAHGDRVEILVRVGDDAGFGALVSWVIDDERVRRVTEDPRWGGIVFSGSVLDDRGYGADSTGTIASLTPFSTDVLAPVWTVSPDAKTDAPEWIADPGRVPERGVSVRVRVERVGGAPPSEHPEGVDVDDE